MINTAKKCILFGSILLLTACDTTPERPMTALESCLNDVKRDGAMCTLGEVGNVMAGSNRGAQICKDRQMMQEDRCYARFK